MVLSCPLLSSESVPAVTLGCACNTNTALNVMLDATPHAVATTVGAAAADSFITVPLCNLLQDATNDTYNSIASNMNATVTTLACTINQIVEYLKCLGPGTCVLTGPTPCCQPAGGPVTQPATVSFGLPNILTGMGTCPVITTPLLNPGAIITPAFRF